eukprot:TRINITY_DN33532_c0_g1_i1.p1 TRINITY_DN33532_c0_g1~~TRINITY_DN33532_c0_g1_i1.p1  ORF type:complete len:113 (+),score=33.04 TRINITY_DN33532_c0_g1_i1:206-544(+)
MGCGCLQSETVEVALEMLDSDDRYCVEAKEMEEFYHSELARFVAQGSAGFYRVRTRALTLLVKLLARVIPAVEECCQLSLLETLQQLAQLASSTLSSFRNKRCLQKLSLIHI